MRLDYIVRRLLHVFPAMLGAVTLVFAITRLAPGDPLQIILGDFAGSISQSAITAIKHEYGFDHPLYYQYVVYVGNMLRGHFGSFLANGQPVTQLLTPHIAPTVMLTAGALRALARSCVR